MLAPANSEASQKVTRMYGSAVAIAATDRKENIMLRYALIGLATAALLTTTFVPDEALARGGRGGGFRGGGGGFHGGGVRGGGFRGGAVHAGGVRGGAYRGAAVRGGAYRGVGYRGVARGVGWGAAAGAAAVGAGYYGGYGSSCYRDSYGQVICPNQW
jgi:hypothetical protein